MLENRFSLLEVEDNDNQAQVNKRKKKQESTPNQLTPAQRAKNNERKKKQKSVSDAPKRVVDPSELENFIPVGGRDEKEKTKGPKKMTREEFERERKLNPDSPILRGVLPDEDTTKPQKDDNFEYRTRGGKTRNRGRIQDTDKDNQRSPNNPPRNSPNNPPRNSPGRNSPNANSPSNRFNRGKNQGGNKYQGKNQGGNKYQGKNQGANKYQPKNQEGTDNRPKNQGGTDNRSKNQGGTDNRSKNQGGYRGNENRPKKYQGGGTPASQETQERRKKGKYTAEPPVHGRPDERKPRSDVDTHKGGRGGATAWGDDVKEQKKAAEEGANKDEELSGSDKKDSKGDDESSEYFTEPDEEGKEKAGVSKRKGYNAFIKDMEEQQNEINELLKKHHVETKKAKIEPGTVPTEVETANISKKSHDIVIDQENDAWMIKKNTPGQVEKKRKEKKQPKIVPITDVVQDVRMRRHKGINMPIERTENAERDSEKPERKDNREDPGTVDSPDWDQGKKRKPENRENRQDRDRQDRDRQDRDRQDEQQGTNSPDYNQGKRRKPENRDNRQDRDRDWDNREKRQGGRTQGVGKKVPNIKNENIFPPLSQDPAVVNKAPSAWEGRKIFDLS